MKNRIKPLNKEHLNELFDRDLTFGEKIADTVADFVGSWKFIILVSVFLALWMAVNYMGMVFGLPVVFDKPPFILLNLILSFIAAYQAPLIMMSQNRQADKDRARDQLQFDITTEIRTELFEIHEKMDQINPNTEEFAELKVRLEKVLESLNKPKRKPK